ncbi:hypothetical protein ACJW31_09G021600 [Castanea mollissima]
MRILLSERQFRAEHEMNDEMKENVWSSAHEHRSLLVHGFSGSEEMMLDYGGERMNGGPSYPTFIVEIGQPLCFMNAVYFTLIMMKEMDRRRGMHWGFWRTG